MVLKCRGLARAQTASSKQNSYEEQPHTASLASVCDRANRGGQWCSSCSQCEEEAMPRDSWPQDLCGGSWSSNAEGWLGPRLPQANRIPMRNSPIQPPLPLYVTGLTEVDSGCSSCSQCE